MCARSVEHSLLFQITSCIMPCLLAACVVNIVQASMILSQIMYLQCCHEFMILLSSILILHSAILATVLLIIIILLLLLSLLHGSIVASYSVTVPD